MECPSQNKIFQDLLFVSYNELSLFTFEIRISFSIHSEIVGCDLPSRHKNRCLELSGRWSLSERFYLEFDFHTAELWVGALPAYRHRRGDRRGKIMRRKSLDPPNKFWIVRRFVDVDLQRIVVISLDFLKAHSASVNLLPLRLSGCRARCSHLALWCYPAWATFGLSKWSIFPLLVVSYSLHLTLSMFVSKLHCSCQVMWPDIKALNPQTLKI